VTATGVRPPAVRIWDLPIRLFHWTLLGVVLLAWRTAETHELGLHRLAGSAVAGLLVFRLWWGLFGGSSARFASFVKGPKAVWGYARALFSGGAAEPEAGHNPLGGWSVAALLTCLLVLVGAGLFAVDVDGLESGPFAGRVDFDLGRLASHIHALAFDALEALVALHLAAIAFYAIVKRRDLVGPMLTGRSAAVAPARAATAGSPLMLAVGAALGLLMAGALIRLGGAG
jgi:cytochrome b